MKHPPYFLRFNKAADRYALVEAIKLLGKAGMNLEEYTYYSLGGPYLEDFRLIYEHFPEMNLVSIEEDEQTLERQRFHLPCAKIDLINTDMKSFIDQYFPNDKRGIFWLDYTGLEYSHFEEFEALLGKSVPGSMIKITLKADPREYHRGSIKERNKLAEEFRKTFRKILPDPMANIPWKIEDFVIFVQTMLKISTEKVLPADSNPFVFQPVSSFYYSDGTWMLTLTGVIWPRDKIKKILDVFKKWEFANINWSEPNLIEIPVLTTKERLRLQPLLPCAQPMGKTLFTELGYLISDDVAKTEIALEQYAKFHRYSPYFMQSIP